MTHSKVLLSVLAAVLLLSSCTIEKRRHLSGYHIDWKHRGEMAQQKPVTSTEQDLLAAEFRASTEFGTVVAVTEDVVVLPLAVVSTPKVAINHEHPKAAVKAAVEVPSGSATAYLFKSPSKLSAGKAAPMAGTTFANSRSAAQIGTVGLVIIAFFIPFLAVYLHQGSWNSTCWLNLLLTLLFWLPGFIHALIVIL